VEESVVAIQLAHHISRARLGRRRLALHTGLTEMAVRIELERLRDRRLVRLSRGGVELTPAGRRRFSPSLRFVRSVARLELTSLRIDDVGVAAHVAPCEFGSVWGLRDAAVREGATGLLLLRFGLSGWAFAHDGESVQLRNPEDAESIAAVFPEPAQADLLLIAFGPDLKCAGLGLWHSVSAMLFPS